METIATKRLLLREIELSDAESITKYANSKQVSDLVVSLPHPYTIEHALSFIKDTTYQYSLKDPNNYQFGIALATTNEIIGLIGLNKVDWVNLSSEIGYWLGKEHHGNGFMSEAEKEVLKIGFNNIGLNRIYGYALNYNDASNALFDKFGFRRVGVLEEAKIKDGEKSDLFLWELLKRYYSP